MTIITDRGSKVKISNWISEEILWHNIRGFVTYEKTMT